MLRNALREIYHPLLIIIGVLWPASKMSETVVIVLEYACVVCLSVVQWVTEVRQVRVLK